MKALWKSESGASLVEFAILVPVMVFLLLGLVNVGRYAYTALYAASAARSGVQYGAQNPTFALDNNGMQNAATTDAQNLNGLTAHASHFCTVNGTVSGCPSANATPAPGQLYYVQVQVTGMFNPLIAYPGIPKNIPIGSTAVMRVISQ